MKKLFLLFFLIASCTTEREKIPDPLPKPVANTPPMGWNSWNCFGVTVNEEQVKANADYLAAHLKEFGYEYIVVDLGWYLPPDITTATFKVDKPPQAVDAYGRLIPDIVKFPSSVNRNGFRPLADYVHSLGLKFGIHIMRGIPWQAVKNDYPVKGSKYSASKIANSSDTCSWYDGMVGVDMTKKGAQEYYHSLIELYTEWGVDFIKADDMSHPYHLKEIEGLSRAINNSEKNIVFSLSPGPSSLEQAIHLQENANMWRISGDFWDHWPLLKDQFALCREWKPYQHPNQWPDADMLPVGKLRITGPDDYVAKMMEKKPEEITNEFSRLTRAEQVSLMSLWCFFRSPLIIGGHLPENDSFTLSLLTNRSLLDINQNGINNREVFFSNDWVVWTAGRPGSNDQYVAIFNLDDHGSRTLKLEWSVLGLKGKYQVIDAWTNEPLGQHQEELFIEAEAHGSRMIHLIASDGE